MVYKFGKENLGWDQDKADKFIITKSTASNPQGIESDPKSIMLYPFGPEFFQDGLATNTNFVLSAKDKELLAMMYPPANARSDGYACYVNPNYDKIPTGIMPVANDKSTVFEKFDPPYPKPPQVVVGITSLVLDSSTEIDKKFETSTNSVTEKGFNLTMETWGSSILYACEVIHVDIPTDDPKIQGQYLSD